jgi:ribosome biogenesis SPOUT family RNA methylase Rps3
LKLGAGLHVLDQDVYITVQAAMGDEQASLDAAKSLAKLVLERAGHPQE